ncbi:hypothetical protein AVEN_82744-1 [Araneus ventricosus]|uniref:Uncharacterized protein n=1 Tax=Araneus ventricosus TaxID=182803 RepID=A0A4Y2ECR1_ARAVE|nr:hypothetical protein AVEN_82744-1 [Araneus ventricosus]
MVSCLIEEHRLLSPACNNTSLELEGLSLRHPLGEGAAIETKQQFMASGLSTTLNKIMELLSLPQVHHPFQKLTESFHRKRGTKSNAFSTGLEEEFIPSGVRFL